MCGRYNFTADEAEEIKKIIQEVNDRLYGPPIKTGEIYPTNLVPVVLQDNEPVPMTWGFPHFKNSGVIINARAETVLEKRMFRDSVISRRCLVPSTGFYEWQKLSDGSKRKLLFRQPDSSVLWMAGFWNTFKEEQRFVILTTGANSWMRENDSGDLIHDRMPVILQPEERELWLGDAADFDHLFKRDEIELEYQVA